MIRARAVSKRLLTTTNAILTKTQETFIFKLNKIAFQ